jgi:hypothetical protein
MKEMQVKVAQDVLKLLASKKITATTGTYFISPINLRRGEDVQQFLMKLQEPCQVCMVGAAFAAKVMADDNFVSQHNGPMAAPRHEMAKFLLEVFGQEELDLIEDAFEGYAEFSHIDSPDDDSDLMTRICNSIIECGEVNREHLLVALQAPSV